MQYIYLHGFASSPQSAKARYLGDRFQQVGIPLITPDLNQGNFTDLTLSRQMQQVETLFPSSSEGITLIGSSFGGLTAAWLGQKLPVVKRLVLLAPAFGFLAHWLPRLGEAQVRQWQETGFLSVFHYSANQMLPLSYQFVEDASRYQETEIQRSLPTLILHGDRDEVIPIAASIQFAKARPWVTLIQLDSDHALTDVSDEIWQAITKFCQINSP